MGKETTHTYTESREGLINNTVIKIELGETGQQYEPFKKLIAALKKNTSLRKLDVSKFFLTKRGTAGIRMAYITMWDALKTHSAIEEIVFSEIPLVDLAKDSPGIYFSKIVDFIRQSKTIKTLDFHNTSFSSIETFTAIATALNNHPSVEHINFSGCGNTPDYMIQFLAILGTNLGQGERLRSITLTDANIGDIGFESFAGGLARNKTLRSVNLAHNPIGKMGGECLLKALEQNRVVVIEGLEETKIPKDLLEAIQKLLKNRRLEEAAAHEEHKEHEEHEEHEEERKITIPNEYLCQISEEIMLDPVSTSDGHTYERKNIEEWLIKKGKNTSPATGAVLPDKKLTPNWSLKKLISDFVQENKAFFCRQLLKAAEAGDVQEVEKLLKLGVDVNARNINREIALHLASERGHLKVVQLILTYKPALNAKDKNNWTPLCKAVGAWRNDVAKLLITNHADIETTCVNATGGWTALHLAAFNGNAEMVAFLLQHKVNVDPQNDLGETPLFLAAIHANTAFPETADYTYHEIIESLLEFHASIDLPDNKGCTPLHRAVDTKQAAIVKQLLHQGADPDATNNADQTIKQLANEREGMAVVFSKETSELRRQQRLVPVKIQQQREQIKELQRTIENLQQQVSQATREIAKLKSGQDANDDVSRAVASGESSPVAGSFFK